MADAPFRRCEFCGCNTNARMRACCDRGRDADIIASLRAQIDAAQFDAAQERRNYLAMQADRDEMGAQVAALQAERDAMRARNERLVRILAGIHAVTYPKPTTGPDGTVYVFRQKDPDPHTILQVLSDRIRAIPDEIDAASDGLPGGT